MKFNKGGLGQWARFRAVTEDVEWTEKSVRFKPSSQFKPFSPLKALLTTPQPQIPLSPLPTSEQPFALYTQWVLFAPKPPLKPHVKPPRTPPVSQAVSQIEHSAELPYAHITGCLRLRNDLTTVFDSTMCFREWKTIIWPIPNFRGKISRKRPFGKFPLKFNEHF